MRGKRVCYHHGAKSPSGIASKSFKTGRYSKDLPPPIAGRYQQALENREELLRLYDDIALLDARIAELCQNLESGERGTLFEDIQLTLMDLDAAKQAGEPIDPFLDALRAIASKGKETIQAWHAIEAMIHSKAKIVAIEGRRQADMGETATKDQVKTLVLQIVNVVKDHVTDRQALMGISQDLRIILNGTHQNTVDKPPPFCPTNHLAENSAVHDASDANPTSTAPNAPDAG